MLDQRLNPPKPTTRSFAGLTILITGASTGLGLEAAKKIAALGVDRLIITARNESKGQAAKKTIEAFVASNPGPATSKHTEIIPMTLDMGSFAEVQKFADTLKKQFSSIDGAILNAGMMQNTYVETGDGWEETMQVNTLSTLLLGLELLPLLLASADAAADTAKKNDDYKPHLTFISSGTAWLVKPEQMQDFMASDTPLEAISASTAFPPGLMGGSSVYGRSKLLLEYGVRHLAASPALTGPDGKPKVIVNTNCPGLCKSDLGRRATTNPIMKIIAWLIFSIIARTPGQGAETYLQAVTKGDETHGQMWKNDRVFEPGPMLATPEGREFGDRIWSEIQQVMLKANPTTKAFLT